MKNRLTKFMGILACATGLVASPASAGEVEVLHWWTSAGEAKSISVLKDHMEENGHTWKDFAVAGGGGGNATTVLRSRVISGNPPAAAQIKGLAIQEWAESGALADLEKIASKAAWDNLIPEEIATGLKYEGKYVAAPVNVHRTNWMYVNPEVFKKAGATIPTTWGEFEEAAEKIQKAGFIPVAYGGQAWQDATTFEGVVLSVGGSYFYRKAFIELDQQALNSPTMVKAFEVLNLIKKYTDDNAPGRDWNLATAMVIKGEAAMQFMGDWAKGEFTAAGKKPAEDFVCMPYPGSKGLFIANVDSFVLFDGIAEGNLKAQEEFARYIMEPEFQIGFNVHKGSIPVRLDLPRENFDSCANDSIDEFRSSIQTGTMVPTMAHGMAASPAVQGAYYDVVTNFFNSDMTPEKAAETLAKVIKDNQEI